jgi:ketosteroid isomerase-like protein
MGHEAAVAEVTATIHGLVEATNTMWSEGVIDGVSRVLDVEPELKAVQFSPRFESQVWRANSGKEWIQGTAQAADALRGQGCRWSLHDLQVRARSDIECVAAYRIVHTWADGRRPAQAIFLETWRRGDDGRWRLARHTAEKI